MVALKAWMWLIWTMLMSADQMLLMRALGPCRFLMLEIPILALSRGSETATVVYFAGLACEF